MNYYPISMHAKFNIQNKILEKLLNLQHKYLCINLLYQIFYLYRQKHYYNARDIIKLLKYQGVSFFKD